MKKIAILAFPVFLLSACTDILNKQPLGILDSGSYFQTADDAVQAVNAAYQSLTFSVTNNNFYWGFGVIASDEAIVGGDGSRPGLTELDFFTWTPRTQEFTDFWALNYKGIAQCNVVLERVPDIDMNAELKNRVLGEAYFLRAYYYFLLTQVFGDVPLYTKVTPPDELKVAKTPVSEVRRQIIADCETAAGLLPVQHTLANTGRATKGAAFALAAKTSLYEKNWQDALSWIEKVKSAGIYGLMPDYLDNFRENSQNNQESVWEIQHTNLESGTGNSLNQWWASKKVTDGYGFAEVTQSFFDAFDPLDPRRGFTIAKNNDQYFGVVYKNSFSSTKLGVKKYLQASSEVTQKADGDINYTAIRYAEVLLWEAEALAELGRVEEAKVPLELVRARARAQAATPATALPPVVTSDQQELIQAIRKERQFELGFECHRYFDLVRWGIAGTVIPEFQAGKHEVFPIPQTEIDLNPNLVQNPGY